MIFIFKKKKLIVDAFTYERYINVYEAMPIDYSHKFYPQWWKNVNKGERTKDSILNVKGCIGIANVYTNSITLPMWSDIELDVVSGEWRFSDGFSKLDFHPQVQRGEFKKDHLHFKFICPWYLKSEKGVNFSYIGDYYNHNDLPIEVAPGIVDYYYQHSINFNFLVPKQVKKVFIPVGTPLAIITPLTEREVILKRHLVSDEEYMKIYAKHSPLSFGRKYYTNKRLREAQETKCPFGG
jgi:hypothetical protein